MLTLGAVNRKILFFRPTDFAFVCLTEIAALSKLKRDSHDCDALLRAPRSIANSSILPGARSTGI
jgi:hypothetical protein